MRLTIFALAILCQVLGAAALADDHQADVAAASRDRRLTPRSAAVGIAHPREDQPCRKHLRSDYPSLALGVESGAEFPRAQRDVECVARSAKA